MAVNNKPKRARRKGDAPPRKPPNYPDFPLYSHPLGYWSKKIGGKIMHFGRWGRVVNGRMQSLPYDEGWREALKNYKARIDDARLGYISGTVVNAKTAVVEGVTLADVCNEFRTAKQLKFESKGIGKRTYEEYVSTTDRLIKRFGGKRRVDDLGASDFALLRKELADSYGPYRLGNEVQKVRTVFRYALAAGVIDKPVRFGPEFVKPSEAAVRKHRAKMGKRMMEPAECRKLIDAAGGPLKAMILLGLNCGFGNHDCATLPFETENGSKVIDLDSGWIEYARPKTGIERRAPLWPETIKAIKDSIAARPKPKIDADGLVFLLPSGRPWLCRGIANPVSVAASALMKECGIKDKANDNGSKEEKKGFGFYTLRHVFRTVADGSKDQPAIRLIMGHVDQGIDADYRETIDDARLLAVTNHVRAWLFGGAT